MVKIAMDSLFSICVHFSVSGVIDSNCSLVVPLFNFTRRYLSLVLKSTRSTRSSELPRSAFSIKGRYQQQLHGLGMRLADQEPVMHVVDALSAGPI